MSKQRAERRLLWLFAGIELTLLLDFMVLMPLAPELTRQLHVSPAEFGGMVSSYTLASAFAGLTGAWWLHRVERKRALLLLYAGFIAASAGCGLAHTATLFAACRALAGAFAGLSAALVMAWIADAVPAERRGDAIGFVLTAYAVSGVVGVPLGLLLAEHAGWQAPFFAVTALAFLHWLLLCRSPRPAAAADTAAIPVSTLATPLVSARTILSWLLTASVVGAGFLMIPQLGTFMVANLGVASGDLAKVYFGGGIAAFAASRLVGRCVDRWGAPRVLGVLLLSSSAVHIGFTHLEQQSLLLSIAAFAAFMTFTSARMVPTYAFLAERTPPALRARFFSVNTAVADLAMGVAASIGGALVTREPDGALRGLGGVSLVATGVSLLALCVLAHVARGNAQPASTASSVAVGDVA